MHGGADVTIGLASHLAFQHPVAGLHQRRLAMAPICWRSGTVNCWGKGPARIGPWLIRSCDGRS